MGSLTLRITKIGADIERHPGLEWVHVEGIEQLADGGEGGQRRVLVRAAALRNIGSCRDRTSHPR